MNQVSKPENSSTTLLKNPGSVITPTLPPITYYFKSPIARAIRYDWIFTGDEKVVSVHVELKAVV